MPDPWIFVDLLIRGAVIALLALLATLIAKHRRQSPALVFGLALALGMIIYVLQTAPPFESVSNRYLEIALVAVSNGNNPLFWFFALALFDDDFRAQSWQWVLWSLIVCFAALTLLSHDGAHVMTPMNLHFWSHRILAWLPIAFVALTIAAAFKHWRADLVERRRWLRAFIVVTGFLYMFGSAIARLDTSDGRFTTHSGFVDILVLSVIVFVIAWRLLDLDIGELLHFRGGGLTQQAADSITPANAGAQFDVQSVVCSDAQSDGQTAARSDAQSDAKSDMRSNGRSEPNADPQEQVLALALDSLINHEKVYREENLTISRLATKLAVPEYRLRRLINQRLGYRNFNAFLNTYRLQQVVAAMAEPKSSHLPILTLALDAGFQSIGPFNRAFKLQFEMTPTEFRTKHRADSGIG